MRRSKPNRMHEIIQTLMGLKQLDSADTGQLAAMQQMQQGAEMQPLAVEAAKQQNALAAEQVAAAPAITKAKLANATYQGIGELGQGLGMSAPQIAPQVMQRILEAQGLYTQDPNAELMKLAASLKLTPQQVQQFVAARSAQPIH